MRRPLHLLALLLLVASCAVVTACGVTTSRRSERRHQHRREHPAAKKIKVGLVTDIGGLNDRSFNQLANEGLERAKSELGRRDPRADLQGELGLRAEPLDAGAAEVRPRHRRRLPDGRGDGHRRLEVPGHEVRDHRRRRDGPQEQAHQRRRPALQGAGGGLPRRLHGRPVPQGQRRRTRPARSAARRSRRSTTTSPATRPASRPPTRTRRSPTATRRSSTIRRRARSSRSTRSPRARRSSSRSRAAAASARWTRPRRRACRASASTPTRPTSATRS